MIAGVAKGQRGSTRVREPVGGPQLPPGQGTVAPLFAARGAPLFPREGCPYTPGCSRPLGAPAGPFVGRPSTAPCRTCALLGFFVSRRAYRYSTHRLLQGFSLAKIQAIVQGALGWALVPFMLFSAVVLLTGCLVSGLAAIWRVRLVLWLWLLFLGAGVSI